MREERRQALVDFLLEAVADEGTTPFPADVLAGLRSVARCETVCYREWSAQELLAFSLAADEPGLILPVWHVYPQVRQDDPLPAGSLRGSPLPHKEWFGRTLAISDFLSDREFRRRGLYAEVCKPLGVRAVMKVFLPTGAGPARRWCSIPAGANSPRATASPSSGWSRTWRSCGATHSRGGPIRRLSIPPQPPG